MYSSVLKKFLNKNILKIFNFEVQKRSVFDYGSEIFAMNLNNSSVCVEES